MTTAAQDAQYIVDEMETIADEATTRGGIDPDELDDFDFPEELRARITRAMSHWEDGVYHLHEAHKAMKAIAEELKAKEAQECPTTPPSPTTPAITETPESSRF